MDITDIVKTPPHSAQAFEIRNIFKQLKRKHPYLSHEFFEKAEAAAQGYVNDATWKTRGIDAKELDPYIESLKTLMPERYHSVLPEFRAELVKAISGTYGNPMGI